jgi:hypothetical protein
MAIPEPQEVGRQVTLLVAGLTLRHPEADKIPRDVLRRQAAELLMSKRREKPLVIDPE